MGGTWSSGPGASAELEQVKKQLAMSQAEVAALRAGTAAGRALAPVEAQLTALFARLEAAEAAAGIAARKSSVGEGELPLHVLHRDCVQNSSPSLLQSAGFEAERCEGPEGLYQYETTAATRASLSRGTAESEATAVGAPAAT